ncbi:monofunctional biosynthetic peptidoglycan transglycosylase [Paracoccus sp. (in: a-proteobacteria)]|uniref:monofunctional biosynthetic peptidoglycan transglycosylase n=1 Tax=Paracoccus sp. TaxID=267 RepID=UPI0034CDA16C
MFRKTAARSNPPVPATRRRALLRLVLGWLRWLTLRALVVMLVLVGLFALVNPPTTLTIAREATAPRQWTRLRDVSPVLARSIVAAEDANFCHHWGFDMVEIRRVIDSGGRRGASTITQQTAKNLYLWQSRSWTRKALETLLTPMIEALWSKRRILEVYLNIAEFGDGVFGIHAASAHYFGTTPDRLTATQSARLAAVLPAPKLRSPRQSRRSAAIADGAATILRDGRAACFTLPARD